MNVPSEPDPAPAQDDGHAGDLLPRLRVPFASLREYLLALNDFGFQQWLTPRLAPVLYALGVAGSAYLVAIFVAAGFTQSWTAGRRSHSMTLSSTRRLFSRPCSVSLVSIGWLSP
ncbi:MAG: hypothetical protein QM661_10540 [Solimonas sp.]